MVEISNARYEQLIKAETVLHAVKLLAKKVPSYKWDESLMALVLEESEGEADAE